MKNMKFIDLFAGIGGFHLALSRLGMTCNFASEIDPFAREVYLKNHKIDINIFNKDIRSISPESIPLKLTMSDIWEGHCSRQIGYTLRVGGRGSPINDRRNWDGYIVDNKEVRLSPKQGKRMMGYPDDFELSSSPTQAMKQLGNSVCVDVVYHIAKNMKAYIDRYTKK